MSNSESQEGNQGDPLGQRADDSQKRQAALKEAMRRVMSEHARAGRKVVIWKDGQVVWEDPVKKDE